ncbi:MAG: hypothetical protein SFW35_11140 [Chitinophagales bacterium]|nr:hypothetical protein [Chitinophagales bacterium]
MNPELRNLLAQLNFETLQNFLPCFYDAPNEIQFRIGLQNEGPYIKFYPELVDNYYLEICNQAGQNVFFMVTLDSEAFPICQRIHQDIRRLCANINYFNLVNQQILVRRGNIQQIVDPIIQRIGLGNIIP